MKKVLVLCLILFYGYCISFAEVASNSNAVITELFFDDNGDWTIEMYFQEYDADADTGYVLITASDTAYFWKFPDTSGFVLITADDLSHLITIKRFGGILWCENWAAGSGSPLTERFVWGWHPSSQVKAPYPGQTLVSLLEEEIEPEQCIVKDTSSSLGYLREPAKGILRGYLYDSLGIPLPYIRIQTSGIVSKTLWSDENGLFTDTLYAKDYAIWIMNGNTEKIFQSEFCIEPDSINQFDIYLPVSASVQHSGYCYLADTDDHAGTQIILTSACPFAPNDTLATDSSGHFSGIIKPGHYMFRYSHPGFLPWTTHLYRDTFFDFERNPETLPAGIVHEVEEDSSRGRWTDDYPYWIFADINVHKGDSLILDPGVEVIFKRINSFNVHGTLLSAGSDENGIRISNAGSSAVKWDALIFFGESSSNSKLSFTEVSYNSGGIQLDDASPNFTDCQFIRTWQIENRGCSAPLIKNCYVEPIVYPGIDCLDNSAPVITGNFLKTGARCVDSSQPVLKNNIIFVGFPNYDHSSALIFHNTFYSCFSAVLIQNNASPKIMGNIFHSSERAINIRYGSPPEVVRHNLFYDLEEGILVTTGEDIPGLGIMDRLNRNGDSCDRYYNLTMDPMLVNPESNDFNLLSSSPCIDAGYPFYPYDPDSTIADIGAFYFHQTTVAVEDIKVNHPETLIYHYPNPSSGEIYFVAEGIDLQPVSNMHIDIYNMNGERVDRIPFPCTDRRNSKKIHRYNLGANRKLKTGTYLYTLCSDDETIAINKLVYLQ